ncbi:MAG: peptidase m28 [Hyphomonadaceae bacterium]|nr:MAG: peptidase m28 [Hyphomonadaceae bacterium]
MKNFLKFASLALVLPLIMSVNDTIARPRGIAAPATAQISTQRLSDDIKEVSSDAFEGRGVGTRAEIKTIDFLVRGFTAAGFAPGGTNGGWTQEVALRKFNIIDPHLSLNLGARTKELREGEDITISTRGSLSDVHIENVPLVFVGYGVTAPERNWNDYKGADGRDIDVSGKIVVMLINDPDYYEPELNIFGGKAMTYYGRWTYKYEEAARRGALGVMIIHETGPAAYGWATVKNSNRGEKLDIVRENLATVGPKLESWISFAQAQEIFGAAGADLENLKAQARTRDFHPIVLNNVSLNGHFGVRTQIIRSHNVIARLRGRTRPNENVIYTAHWDHLGIGSPDATGDNIFNGAQDNGTGIAALLELSRAFSRGPRPERSVVMIAFTAEESGLLGSEFYATNPVYPLARTVAGINMDSLNVFGAARNISVTGVGQSQMEDILARHANTQNRVLTSEDKPENGHFFRSDHFPLVKRGVPMLVAGSGVDAVNGGAETGRSKREDYVTNRYHQPSDEWSSDWDYSGMVQDLQLYYNIGREIANSRNWPAWRATSEFKAARDRSLAGH